MSIDSPRHFRFSSEVVPIRYHPREIRHHSRSVTGRVVGVTPGYSNLQDLPLQEGRFIEELDCSQLLPVVVLGSQVADELFPISSPLGESIRIGEQEYFRVVGVLRPRADCFRIEFGVTLRKTLEMMSTSPFPPMQSDLESMSPSTEIEQHRRTSRNQPTHPLGSEYAADSADSTDRGVHHPRAKERS